jgi:hypothetical protein
VLGVALLVVVGTPGGSTEVLPAAQTLPEGYERPGDAGERGTPSGPSTTTAPATTTPPGPSSFPDGSPAPDGVAEVLVDGGSTTLTFSLPEGFAVDTATPAVPATSAATVDDGAALTVRTGCAESSDEVLAQINVTEDEESVSVLAVVLVPPGGAPCEPGVGSVVEVPLRSPLAGRTLEVVPQRTALPSIGAVG